MLLGRKKDLNIFKEATGTRKNADCLHLRLHLEYQKLKMSVILHCSCAFFLGAGGGKI